MKKILLSMLMLTAAVSAVALGTSAYFSDTETSINNTFTTGTIDIAVDGENPWARTTPYTLADMKPSYTEYIEFEVQNVGTNPTNVWKDINVTAWENAPVSEPECVAEGGSYAAGVCTGETAVTDLENQILYGLSVQVFNPSNVMVWEQTLYAEDITLAAAYTTTDPNGIYLGMVPAGWRMVVSQSYLMDPAAENEYQGDAITFDINLYAEQLKGSVVLEDKNPSTWQLALGDAVMGTLTYKVKHPTFAFTFTGNAPLANTEYVLAAGYDGGTNVDTELGRGTTDASGNLTFSGDVELNKNMESVKVWLVPASAWNINQVSNWGQMSNFLWETGLIEYVDTDL